MFSEAGAPDAGQFQYGGAGWLPYWMERLDEHFEKLQPQWPDLQRKPSETIRNTTGLRVFGISNAVNRSVATISQR